MSFFSEIFQDLSKIPGSPEAVTSAVEGGLNGSLSWNPFSKSNSVWDTGAGGTQLSQNPTDRMIGRTIGSLFAGGALGGALGGGASASTDAATAGSDIGSFAADGSYIPAAGADPYGLSASTALDGGASFPTDAATAAANGSALSGAASDPYGFNASTAFDGSAITPSGSSGVGSFAPDGSYIPASGTSPSYGSPGASDPGSPGAGGSPTDPTNPATSQDKSWLSKALGTLGNNKLQTAQLGLGTLGLINQVKQGSNAQKQMNAIAGPASQASQQLLAQFKAGQINPSDAYAIQQWQQTQQAQSDQYFAQAGLSNSSMHQQASSQIAAQAEAMRQQAVQNLLTQGLSAAGVANPTLVAGVNAGLQQDNAAMTTMSNFIATLAKMNTGGGSGGGSNTQTQTGTPNG